MLKQIRKMGWLLWVIPTYAVAAGNIAVHEYQLENGLQLIVKPDHRAPVVVSQVWYKVGSSYEHNGITGISHQLEHMMFKGTKTLGVNEFSKIIAENGGDENAFTGRDYTAYFQTLENDRLDVSFRLEADRMRNLIIDPAELEKEHSVVAEERRMRTDDNPDSLLREAFSATAFVNSPYHHPVIGWMSDIMHYEADDLRAWYTKWYAPNNATVVVVGDVDPEAVYQLAKRYFGPLKPETIPSLKPQIETIQIGKRSITINTPAELPALILGWKVPVVNTISETAAWEPYALEMLVGILDGGDSARFPHDLVRGSEVAAGVGAGYNLFSRLGDVFMIAGTPATGKTIADLEVAIMQQITRLQTEAVSDAELTRVQAQVIASAVYERDSIFYQAMQIGMLETVGLDWRLTDAYVDNVKQVTAAQVQMVAKKYFQDKGLTRGELVPITSKQASAAGENREH